VNCSGGGAVGNAQGVFVSILPFIEQAPLYSAWNSDIAMFTDTNETISGTALSTLWCPSDGSLSSAIHTYGPSEIYNHQPHRMRYTNYKGNMGYWTMGVTGYNNGATGEPTDNASRLANLRKMNGPIVSLGYGGVIDIFLPSRAGVHRSNVRLAEITDGTSNTAALSEHAHGLLAKGDYVPGTFFDWGWWSSGNLGDNMYTAYYPPNPQRKTLDIKAVDQGGAYVNAASSFHPGGTNVGMCDGSVRFIKDTVDSWRLDPTTGLPPGVIGFGAVWDMVPGTKVGVWQGIHSIAGGEVISHSDYQ
jgi:prepilin-type processing-associated H-X9-DG protein